MKAFIKKLNIWKQKVEKNSFEMFSFVEDVLADNDVESDVIKPLAIDHLSNLLTQFQKYFLPELDSVKLDWIHLQSKNKKYQIRLEPICNPKTKYRAPLS